MNQKTSELLNSIRFPLAVGVVFIHNSAALGWKLSQPFEYSLSKYFFTLFSTIIPSVCVPLFFFISGYLFYINIDKSDKCQFFIHKIKKRIGSLLLPYVLWNLIPALILIFKGEQIKINELSSIFWDFSNHYTRLNIFGWHIPFATPINGPLWFVRDLMFAVVASPFIYFFIKRLKIFGVLLLGFVYVFSIWPNTLVFMQVISLFFFSLGCYCSLSGINLFVDRDCLIWLIIPYVVLSTSLSFFSTSMPQHYFQVLLRLYNIFSIIIVLIVISRIIKKQLFQFPPCFFWGGIGFFIYASHTIYVNQIIGCFILPLMIPGDNLLVWTIRYFSSPIMTVLILLLVYYIFKRISPKLLSVLVGGRV
jgi:fucose 4-O-acetylase-like acetyltransferase